MTTPRVTELPLRLEPVEPDPFIDARSPSFGGRQSPAEREERERRIQLVLRVMRYADERARREAIRNGWPARRTERA
jgi:hypothetical protein